MSHITCRPLLSLNPPPQNLGLGKRADDRISQNSAVIQGNAEYSESSKEVSS